MRLALALVLAISVAPTALAADLPRDLMFKVYRDGDELGYESIHFSRNGSELIADTSVDFAVTLAGIRVFHYTVQLRETWQDGKLLAIDSATNNDGDPEQLSLRRTGDQLSIQGTKFQGQVADTAYPMTYWQTDILQATQAIDTTNGRVFPLKVEKVGVETIEAAGRQIQATHYTLSEQLVLNLWYDADGHWVKASFDSDGSLIDYVLQPDGAKPPSN